MCIINITGTHDEENPTPMLGSDNTLPPYSAARGNLRLLLFKTCLFEIGSPLSYTPRNSLNFRIMHEQLLNVKTFHRSGKK